MIGAADALHQATRTLGRAHVNDEIDVAPVDAKVERGRADYAFEFALRHGLFHAAALAGVKRAMMQRDGQGVLVD